MMGAAPRHLGRSEGCALIMPLKKNACNEFFHGKNIWVKVANELGGSQNIIIYRIILQLKNLINLIILMVR